MSFAVEFKEEADHDISQARIWYNSRRVSLGDELLDELDEYVRILEKNPQIYQVRKNNLRYCPLKRFPYLLVYEIEQQKVVVYALFNTYQHPYRLIFRNAKR